MGSALGDIFRKESTLKGFEYGKPKCRERINCGEYLVKYCWRPLGHSGEHMVEGDPVPVTSIKTCPHGKANVGNCQICRKRVCMVCTHCGQAEAVIVEGCPYQVCDTCWAYLGIVQLKPMTAWRRFEELLSLAWLFVRIVWREDQTGFRMSFGTAWSVCAGLRRD